MKKIQQYYIVRHDSPKAIAHSKICAESCEKLGLKYKFVEGFNTRDYWPHEAWNSMNIYENPLKPDFHSAIKTKDKDAPSNRAAMCYASHALTWKTILEDGIDCAGILECDAVLYYSCDIDVPDDMLLALGYKGKDPNMYDHKRMGPPKRVTQIKTFAGSHAYAVTAVTCKKLLDEIAARKTTTLGCIDCDYFNTRRYKGGTYAKLAIVDPISAFGWVRESTIWKNAASNNNEEIQSFKDGKMKKRS